jgi:hypothetical protein
LPGSGDDRLRAGSRVRRLDPAALRGGAINAVLGDQGEDAIGRAAGQPNQRFPALATESRDQFIGIVLEARDHLSAVASRTAVADVTGFEQDHRTARLAERERARQPGIAGADDD